MLEGVRHGPWRIHASRIAYENPWLQIREDKVTRPDGNPGLYGVIIPQDNAAIVAIDDRNRVALVEEFIYPLGVVSLQIPSGGIEGAESPQQAAQRELTEETGLVASEWVDLGQCYLSGGLSTQVSTIFLARGISAADARPEGTETMQLRWMPFDEALRRADAGEIRDAPSLAGLYRAARLAD